MQHIVNMNISTVPIHTQLRLQTSRSNLVNHDSQRLMLSKQRSEIIVVLAKLHRSKEKRTESIPGLTSGSKAA